MTESFRHREYGEPVAIYRYTDSHVICRYLHDGKKQILPWSLIDDRWKPKSAEKPRPLYNTQSLAKLNGSGRVVLVEGEKCVDHLIKLGISRVPMCWPGGAQAAKHADWSSLYGRDVLLFPDHDQPGHECMLWIAGELLKHGSTVSIVKHISDDLPDGWDVADTTWNKDELTAWLRDRIQPITEAPAEPAPPAKRGKPRSRPDGGAPGGSVVDGNTGSVFVSWQQLGLECTQNGAPHPHLANVYKILANHPELVGRIWYDEFYSKVFQTIFQPEPAEWSDTHDTRLTIWIQSNLRIPKIGHQAVQRAVDDYARQNVRNEVREWMDSLEWDGRERLPILFPVAFGTAEDEYNAAVGRCWMVSMAARTYEPGCKVDTMPVFEGPQGIRKSSALAVIGGKWFSEMHEDITTKDFLQNLPGKLLIEVSELHAFRRAEIDRIKGIISCPRDRYRVSYGRRAEDHPRRGVWSGSTNRKDWVQDDTGARRFWPVACSKIDLDYLHKHREQLFAEAVWRYKAGQPWWDIDAELAQKETDQRREPDEWTDAVLYYCKNRREVTVSEILDQVLSLPLRERGKSEQMRVASIFQLAGFARKTAWRDGRTVKIWLTIM